MAGFFIAPKIAQSQANHMNGFETYMCDWLGDYYYSDDTQVVITPDGSLLFKVTMYLPTDHPYAPDHGVNKYEGVSYFMGYVMYDTHIMFHSDGKLVAIFHFNEEGNITPCEEEDDD